MNEPKSNSDCNERLREFVEHDCVGKQYDSCVNSPCRFSSSYGCQHPKHPKRTMSVEENKVVGV